jgi:hypothetical protein
MPRPDHPSIDLGRLAADYERATGHHLDFTWEYEAYPHAGFWSVMVSIDGAVSGAVGEELGGEPDANLVRLTDRLQSEHLGEDFEGDWPKCPHHRSIVMLPKNEGGLAMWTCQADPTHRASPPRKSIGVPATIRPRSVATTASFPSADRRVRVQRLGSGWPSLCTRGLLLTAPCHRPQDDFGPDPEDDQIDDHLPCD